MKAINENLILKKIETDLSKVSLYYKQTNRQTYRQRNFST